MISILLSNDQDAAALAICKAVARSLHLTTLTTEAPDFMLAQAGRKHPKSPKSSDGLRAAGRR